MWGGRCKSHKLFQNLSRYVNWRCGFGDSGATETIGCWIETMFKKNKISQWAISKGQTENILGSHVSRLCTCDMLLMVRIDLVFAGWLLAEMWDSKTDRRAEKSMVIRQGHGSVMSEIDVLYKARSMLSPEPWRVGHNPCLQEARAGKLRRCVSITTFI